MTRPLSILASAAIAVALAGCASRAVEAPALDVRPPERWTAAEPELELTTSGPAWWTEFEDDELDLLVPRVLAANNDLAAAAARVDAAVAQARIAGADLVPSAGVGADASRSRRNFIGFPIPGSAGGVLSSTSTSIGANLNVSWEVDLWGRIRSGRSAARAGVEAARDELEGTRLSLSGQAAKAWFAAREAKLQVELAERTLELRRSSREWIERRYQRGTRGALDLRLAIANQGRAEASLAARRRQLDATGRQIALLASDYPRPVDPGPAVDLPAPPQGLPPFMPSELLARRPDLRALENRLSAAGWNVAQARASLYPRLSLTGSAGRLSDEVEDLLDSDLSVWSLATNLLQPLFQGGRLRAGIELSEARHRELAELYAQALLRSFAEVELALAAERSLADQVEALEIAVDQSTAARDLAQRRYESGLGGYLELLEAQREETQSRVSLLTVERQRLDARVDLHLAMGGGTASGDLEPTTTDVATATP